MEGLSSLFANMDTEFAQAGFENLQLLQKAMEAGSGVNAAEYTGGRALSLESLDQTLVNILHTQDDAVLFQRLKKNPITSPVHQWNERSEVGADDGAWVPEGGDSEETDATINRRYITMKYLQTLRSVTLQATLTKMIEEPMALEKNNGTLWLIRNVERALFDGDSDIITEQPDGLVKLIPSTNVIDLRGKDASSSSYEDAIGEACRIIRDNYGKAGLMLSSTKVIEDTQKLLRDRVRFEARANGTPGSNFATEYPTPFGNPELKADIFIKEGATPTASSLTTKRSSQPTIGSITKASDSASKFTAGDAGDYYYTVVAFNKYGDSVAATTSAAVTVAEGEAVTIPVTEGSIVAAGYKVYRSKKDGSSADLRFMFKVARTAATQDIIDYNSDLPGCSSTFILTMDPVYDAIEWAQFLPMMKFDLYPTNAAKFPFLMLLFGAMALKKKVQHVRVKNIGYSGSDWF